MQLDLFRVRVFGLGQKDLFRSEQTPAQVFRAALFAKPTIPSWRGISWHIGNVQPIDDAGVYFALGRTTRATLPVIDERSGDFKEQEFDSAPYTHVIADTELELCAIARKPALSPTTSAMARQLGRLLTSTEPAQAVGATIEVAVIADPEQFLDSLRRAYAITFFRATFRRPNPWDQNADFLGPLSRTLQAVNGDSGDATVKGSSLDTGPLEEITRSVASTGDNASARMYLERTGRSVHRSLRGDTATFAADTLDDADSRASALAKLRARYGEIRHKPE